jgi:hypothetical protein
MRNRSGLGSTFDGSQGRTVAPSQDGWLQLFRGDPEFGPVCPGKDVVAGASVSESEEYGQLLPSAVAGTLDGNSAGFAWTVPEGHAEGIVRLVDDRALNGQ